jgi:chromosome segregation ATPase
MLADPGSRKLSDHIGQWMGSAMRERVAALERAAAGMEVLRANFTAAMERGNDWKGRAEALMADNKALLDRIGKAHLELEGRERWMGTLALRLTEAQEREHKALANNAALEDEVVNLDARLESARLTLHELARTHTYVDDKLATGLLEVLNIVSKGADIFPLHGPPPWWQDPKTGAQLAPKDLMGAAEQARQG